MRNAYSDHQFIIVLNIKNVKASTEYDNQIQVQVLSVLKKYNLIQKVRMHKVIWMHTVTQPSEIKFE